MTIQKPATYDVLDLKWGFGLGLRSGVLFSTVEWLFKAQWKTCVDNFKTPSTQKGQLWLSRWSTYQKIRGSIPNSYCPHIEESLGKGTEPQIVPRWLRQNPA